MPVFVPYTAAPTHPGAFRQPAPVATSTPAVGGTPILVDQFGGKARLAVEIAFGADLSQDSSTWTWADVTGDTLVPNGGKITMKVGAEDESIQTSPAWCSLLLDNRAEKYSSYNPYSTNWPNVRRNTPVRIRFTLDSTTLNPSWLTLFSGLARGFAPTSDVTGNYAVVQLSVDGWLKRFDRPSKPLKSAIVRAVLAAGPLDYWAMEDGSGSAQIASTLPGGTNASFSGTVNFASDTALTGSAPLPILTATSSMQGVFAGTVTGAATGNWQIDWYHLQSASIVSDTLLWRFGTDNGQTWEVYIGATGGFRVIASGSITDNQSSIFGTGYVGVWVHARLMVKTQIGGNITWTLVAFPLGAPLGEFFTNTIAGFIGNPRTWTQVLNSALAGTGVGHLMLWNNYSFSAVDNAQSGYTAESATTRLARICAEESVPVTITGTSDTTMGAQGTDTFINLLRSCETTDDGMLHDGLSAGLRYLTRASRYNQPAAILLDASVGDPGGVDDTITPVDDDLRDRNMVTVSRSSGSSATYEQATGPRGTADIGEYDYQVIANYADDSLLLARGAHEAKKGTFDGYRYPQQSILFHQSPQLLPGWLQMTVGQRFDIANLRAAGRKLPAEPASLMLDGYTQSISKLEWTTVLNGSPNEPWRVAVIEGAGDTTWRVEAGASTLAANAAAGGTSFVVSTTDGYPWSTSASDYPRDISVGGARATVTAVSVASGNSQTFTVSALPYALPAGAQVTLWRTPKIAL